MKNQFVYRLIGLVLKSNVFNTLIKKNRDGSINVIERNLGVYKSQRTAENTLKRFLKSEHYKQRLYGGFIIYKEKFNDPESTIFYNDVYISRKTFDRFGNYISYMGTPAYSERCYGVDSKYVKYNSGDKIYAYCELTKQLEPQIVMRRPWTKSQIRNFNKKYKTDMPSYHKGCYMTMGTDGEHHVEVTNTFPFFGVLLKKEKKAIIRSAKRYFDKQTYENDIAVLFK